MSPPARRCPACLGERTARFVEKAGQPFARCPDCGLTFADPALPQAALDPLYGAQPEAPNGVRYPFDKAAQRAGRAWRRAWRLDRYIRGREAIDVGCGGGFMVEAMRRRGARATGIDLDPQAIAYAKANHHADNRFARATAQDLADGGERFDFAHTSQVIEHVGDIAGFAAALARLVHPGGWLYLKTPDRDHWWRRQHPMKWPDPPAYVQYFTRASTRALLERSGFRVERVFLDLKPSIQLLARRTEA